MAFPTGWTCYGYTDFPPPASAQVDFPVLAVTENFPSGLSSALRADGGDLRATLNSDGTSPLNREIADTSDPLSEVWVRIPSYSAVGDTRVYWWADGATAEPAANDADHGSQGVWSSNYKLVSHDGGLTDSTSNANNGTAIGGVSGGGATGKIGGATQFDGLNDYFDLTSGISSVAALQTGTVSGWVKQLSATTIGTLMALSETSAYDRFHIAINHDSASSSHGQLYINEGWVIQYSKNGSTNIYNTWALMHTVQDATENKIFINGTNETLIEVAPGADLTAWIGDVTAKNSWLIGAINYNSTSFLYTETILDEVRISSINISTTWATHEYTNQNDPANFGVPGTITTTFTPIMFWIN